MAHHTYRPARAALVGACAAGAVLAYTTLEPWLAEAAVPAAGAQTFNTRAEMRRGGTLAVERVTERTENAAPVDAGASAPAVRPSFRRVTLNGVSLPGIEGRASPGATVDVTIDGRSSGRAAAGADGRWRIEMETALAAGDYRLGVSSRDGAGTRILLGDDIRVSIPQSFAGKNVVLFAADGDITRVAQAGDPARDATRRRAEDLAGAADKKFDELMKKAPATPEAARVAQAQTPPPASVSDTPIDQLRQWTERADREYQQILRQLSTTTPPTGTVVAPPTTTTMTPPKAATTPPATSGRAPAPPAVVPPAPPTTVTQAPPPAAPSPPAQAKPPMAAIPPPPAQPKVATPSADDADWMTRASREYQEIVRRLTTAPEGPASTPPTDATAEAARRAEEARKQVAAADAARKAVEAKTAEMKSAEMKAAEMKAVEMKAAETKAAEMKAAEMKAAELRKTAEDTARRQADETRRLAEAKAAEEARRVTDAKALEMKAAEAKAADAAATQKQADDAARKILQERAEADARRAADLARQVADEARRSAELAAQAEQTRIVEQRAAEVARQAAAAATADTEKRLANQRAAEQQAKATETRRLAEAAQREADQRREAETRASAAARQAADAAKAAGDAATAAKTGPASSTRSSGQTVTAQANKAADAVRRAEDELRIAQAKTPPPPSRPPPGAPSTQAPMQPADTNAPMRRASSGGADSRCARAGRDITLPGWYTIAPGDTLWAIADRHYASGGRFGRIHRANMQRIDDPGLIYPCQRVYLPRR